MTYYIIGTGNTAWYYACNLFKAGHTCKGVWARDINKAHELAVHIESFALESLNDIQDNADVCILAVSDNAIEDVANQLSYKKMILAHTAGSVSRKVLNNATPSNGNMWPLYSIVKDNLPRHRNVPIAVEGSDERSEKVLKELVNSITDISYTVSWKQRQALHLCAVLCNNFTNHMMSVSEEICRDKHVPFSILYPIIKQTADRITQASPKNLQTGPAKRGDIETMEKHLTILENYPEWQALYRTLSTSIDKMYNANNEE